MPLCEAIRQKNLRATGMNSGGGSNDFAEATAQQVKEVANWLALKIYSDAWEVEALRAPVVKALSERCGLGSIVQGSTFIRASR